MNPVLLRALVLVCSFAAVLLVVEVLVGWLVTNRAEGKAINLRLKLIGREGRSEAMNLLRRSNSALPPWVPASLFPLARGVERMLMQTQMTMATGRLMTILLLAPAVIFFLVLLLMSFWWGIGISFGRVVISATFALALGGALPLLALSFKATRMRKLMQEQFPVALDVFVRGLRAGHPIAAALELLTVEMPDPIGSQFGLAVDEVTYGAELRDALQEMAERWDLEDMRMFVVSLSVQNETGGNLAEILDNLSRVIRDRQSMMMKVRALSSEGRMTGLILTVLPVFTFTMLFLLNPRFFLDVANDPAFIPGFAVLIILYVTGLVWIRRLVQLKV